MEMRSFLKTALLSVFVLGGNGLVAEPCTDFGSDLFNGAFHVTHSSTSTKKALSGLTFQVMPTDRTRTLGLRKGETMMTYETYSVSDYELAADVEPKAAEMIKRFDRASIVSFSKSPDLCFLLWASSSNTELVDVNTILGHAGTQDIRLGSNNKRDTSEHMLFSRR